MRRVLFWLLGVLGVLIALPMLGIVVLFMSFNWEPPGFLRGQLTEADFRDRTAGSNKVTTAIRERFPVGTSATSLQNYLRRQGFRPMPPPPADCVPRGHSVPIGVIFVECYDATNTRIYSWSVGLFCGDQVSVRWRTDTSGNITHIEGGYWGACL